MGQYDPHFSRDVFNALAEAQQQNNAEEKSDINRLSEDIVALARNLHKMRQQRRFFFDEALFAEPAWDILLSLAANDDNGMTKVTAVCAASSAPQTTALRHLDRLDEQKLIERVADPLDQRTRLVGLSARGRVKIQHYLEFIARRSAE